jgi:integrase
LVPFGARIGTLVAEYLERQSQQRGSLSATTLRAQTYRTIFALLYALGLRVGEAARLRDSGLLNDGAWVLTRTMKKMEQKVGGLKRKSATGCVA